MKRKMKWLNIMISLSLAFILFTSFTINGLAVNIIIYPEAQEKDYWCWAAVSASIVRVKDSSYDQTKIVRLTKGAVEDIPISPEELNSKFYKGVLLKNSSVVTQSLSTIKNQINAGKAMYAHTGLNGGHHAITIYGYREAGGLLYVNYMNPAPEYERLVTTHTYNALITHANDRPYLEKLITNIY